MDMHHLFVCKEESALCKAISPTGGPTVTDAQVPGYISKRKRAAAKRAKVSNVQKVLSEEARLNADAAVKWALRLHSNGRSLNGKFQASDLKLDPLGNVKCEGTKRVLLKKATPKRKTKDFKRIGKIIKNDIVGVQSVDDLPSVFNRMFAEMECLLVTEPPKYHRIIAAMAFGGGAWKGRAHCNTYVYSIYNFQGRAKNYQDSSEGALYLHRNCFQHLIRDHSTQTIGGVTVVLFVFSQMEHMLGTILPGFIANLMTEMHNESALKKILP